MKVDVDTSTGFEIITLQNVTYIPKFLTNIAFMNLFEIKKMHFDIQIFHLHRKKEKIFRIYKLKKTLYI